MGGDVIAQSQPGQGSVFRLEMTATYTDTVAAQTATTESRTAQHLKDLQAPPRILIVDDREYNVDILAKMLLRVGYQVQAAENGQEAVDQFSTWQPQAILMDIRMPVMDGIEATKRIRALEKKRQPADAKKTGNETLIIAVSASAMEKQRREIMLPGLANDFISKPFKEVEILERLGKHLGVAYVYANHEPREKSDQKGPSPEEAARRVAALPEELVAALRQATVKLDMERLHLLIQEVRKQDLDLATNLELLVEEFNFDQLSQLLETP
jgi:two-component system sensor histidine kinase/response regulator